MRFKIDHDLHIHTYLSSCSKDPEQNKEFILSYAKKKGFGTVAITDHFWDKDAGEPWGFYCPQDYDHIREILPLPKDPEVRFLFGCEGEINKDMVLGISRDKLDSFDFIVIPTTHMHMKGFTISEEEFLVPEACARLWVERLEALLNMDLPFHKVGIAHLSCALLNKKSKDDYLYTLSLIKSEDMERLFKKAAELGVGIEINLGDMEYSEGHEDRVLRMYKIAKACGCKFYLGSDAHHPSEFGNPEYHFGRAIDYLGLTEEDKIPLLRQ